MCWAEFATPPLTFMPSLTMHEHVDGITNPAQRWYLFKRSFYLITPQHHLSHHPQQHEPRPSQHLYEHEPKRLEAKKRGLLAEK